MRFPAESKIVTICLLLFFCWCAPQTVAANDVDPKKGSTAESDTAHPITKIGPWYNTNDFPVNTTESVRRALVDMIETFGDDYPEGRANLVKLADFEKRLAETPHDQALQAEFAEFRKKALLANPLLDFDKLVLVRASRLAAPGLNAYVNTEMRRNGWDHELAVLSDLRDKPQLQVVFKPEKDRPVRDLELHWDAERVMFSTINDAPEANERWGVYEIDLDGGNLRLLTPDEHADVDFFDACYLADGDEIITASTACMQGLPCENGSRPMAVLYRVDPRTKNVRQLTFEQDSDWHPTMLPNGRVMYLRWEYSDIMHYFARILFTMNPDGTNQLALHGSGSYFPTAFKHARPMPDHPHEIIGIVGGHHGRGETGRLCIIDPSIGNKYPFRYRPESKHWGPENTKIDIPTEVYPAEVTGFVQEIPGYGRDVVGNVTDEQGDHLKYNFVYPFPLSRNYYLCSINKAGEGGTYGIYLVDRFDNMTLIHEEKGKGLFEPIPIMKPQKPPVLADRVNLESDTANVFLTDIYQGVGLKDVPRGTVKKLRVFSYHFGYWGSGGHESVGVESSWDIKRILGTVDVEDDGSAFFTIPANTPVSVQPLDENNRAVQLFRSWFVGMPGENVSCVGCHENQANVTPATYAKAAVTSPKPVTPWYGEPRPVAFASEVYEPVVKKFCIGCHDGSEENAKTPSFADAKTAYDNIHPFVNRPGPETDQDVLPPYEYHISSSELVQMLERGHYNVKLDDEAWDRIACWIDLNAPWRGKWQNESQEKRRIELSMLYANIDDNPETEYDAALAAAQRNAPDFVKPQPFVQPTDTLSASHWPFDDEQAAALQRQLGMVEKTLDLGNGVMMKLRRIPAGEFVMGSNDGFPDEAPRAVVRIEKPFWIGETEVTNEQYEAFDPKHDSRYHSEHGKDHVVPGYIANHAEQPVSRVSWVEANKFCDWLGEKSGLAVKLPTEAQWEWAARSGSAEQFYYGDNDVDFSKYANLADASRRYLYAAWEAGATIHVRNPYPENWVFPLRDNRFVDNHFVVDYVKQCLPNAWGLYDMIGNNAEWTRSDAKPYPYKDNDGRNAGSPKTKKIARGGSWIDRPKVTGSATRYHYEPHQKVYVVGFRVVIEE